MAAPAKFDLKEIERRMRAGFDLDYTWFREPVVSATLGPESFNYQPGQCPVAEQTGRDIQVLEARGAAPDHPLSVTCLESEYLKCFICRVV